MKLSTKGRYATRAMLELALRYGRGPMLLREIAQSQEISERYLERIMTALVSFGLVRSSKGHHGGFSLAKPPGETKLREVIQAVEGDVTPVACVDDPKLCDRTDVCVSRDIWKKLKDAITEVLDSITLENMVEMHLKKSKPLRNQMYNI